MGETVVRDLRLHWAALIKAALTGLALVVLATALFMLLSETALALPALLGIAAAYAWMVIKVWSWWVERIYLTDRRLLKTSGLLTRRVAAMPLNKLTDLTFEQSATGRVLGYGRLVVESAGQQQAFESVSFIPEPHDFYQDVAGLVFGDRAAPAATPPPTSATGEVVEPVRITVNPTDPTSPG